MESKIDQITAENYKKYRYSSSMYEQICDFRKELQEQSPLGKDMESEDFDYEKVINLYEVKLYEAGVLLDIVFRTIDGDEAFNYYCDPISSYISHKLEQEGVNNDDFEEKYCEGIEECKKKDLKFVFLRIPISTFQSY